MSNKHFFNLLSSAILNKSVDADLFKGIDDGTWRQIESIARSQSVLALIAAKALSLPNESLPPRPQIMLFISFIEKTENFNRRMIDVLSKLTKEYSKADLPFVLLKGLSNGVNYPEPLLRNPGDIDLYLYRKGDYKRSIDWIKGKGVETSIGDRIHYKYNLDGITIENHSRISYFDNKRYDKQLLRWENELTENDNFVFIEIGGLEVRQLPVELNAFYIFQHLFKHFASSGVGFRQYCDWLLFLSKYHNKIDSNVFTEIANSYALLYPMQVFARAAVKYLDIPESIFPFEIINEDKYADLVIEDIFKGGNFGFHRPGKKRPKNRMLLRWFIVKSTIERSSKFGSLSPEHIRSLPINLILSTLR